MRHTYDGESAVKDAGRLYLPATSGMISRGIKTTNQRGWQEYVAYRLRARYPSFVRDAVQALIGVMHREPPTIELPSSMEFLTDRATLRGEGLADLLRRINERQLVMGRVGVLADVIDVGQMAGMPYLVTYEAEAITNWDEGRRLGDPDRPDGTEPHELNLVILDETGPVRKSNFEWETHQKWRVLVLGDPDENEPMGGGIYRVGVFTEESGGATFSEADLVAPSIMGRTLDRIPFAFANANDVVPEPDVPPLLGLSDLALGIYRGEADYRQALFMQGQDTLVLIGVSDSEDEHAVGAGAVITITNPDGDAKYVGVDSTGLSEMRMALENDHKRAAQQSGELLDSVSRERESGEALRVRVAARTTRLNRIAQTGALALEDVLKAVAEWMGANPDEVVVTPNLDFVSDALSGKELTEYMTARTIGAPLSLRTIHEQMQERGLTERSFEEEIEEMRREEEDAPMPGGVSDRGAPEDEDEEDEDDADAQDDGQDEDEEADS